MGANLDLTTTQLTQVAPPPPRAPEDNWRYTARPEWSSAGESMWIRLSKFSYCNRLSVLELSSLFGAHLPDIESGARDLRQANPWDLQSMATVLNASAADVLQGFCGNLPPILGQAATELRYCAACLKLGFHAAWFQWLTIERCPLHGLPLRVGCARCKSAIPFVLGHDLASTPLTCSHCGKLWIPSLGKPAGRCVALGRRDVRVLKRWGLYVQHVADEEHQPRRDYTTGRFTPAIKCSSRAAAGTPLLTLVNRLFDVPPPLPKQLLARRRHDRLANTERRSLPTTHRGLEFGREQWPHFAEEFVSYEHQVVRARRQFFADTALECDHGRWQHLLDSNLAVSTDSIGCETVAALGWTISWLGRTRALAPADSISTPALGLTAWLANLTPRDQSAHRSLRYKQVQDWLNEDLRLSAWMWMRIARFMQAKGAYLLRGVMVNPPDLANARRTKTENSCMFTSINFQTLDFK